MDKAGQPTITQQDRDLYKRLLGLAQENSYNRQNGKPIVDGLELIALHRTTSLAAQDGLVKHMANRFLGWKLPENFSPDAGISFKPTFNDHLDPPMRNNPIGTNLFNATQAEEMVRYMLEGFDQ